MVGVPVRDHVADLLPIGILAMVRQERGRREWGRVPIEEELPRVGQQVQKS
jgi:hypothetical protein